MGGKKKKEKKSDLVTEALIKPEQIEVTISNNNFCSNVGWERQIREQTQMLLAKLATIYAFQSSSSSL